MPRDWRWPDPPAVALDVADPFAEYDAMLRAFTDSTGVEWRVWSVLPSSNVAAMGADSRSAASLKGTPFADGWLCFESEREKRRLTPIPSSWEFQAPARLEELCAQATRVPLRRQETRMA